MPVLLRRPLVQAGLSGLLLALAFPGGPGIWPLVAVALVPLISAVRQAGARRAFVLGLAAGLVHFLLLLYWIVIVLGHYGGLPWYLAVPALVLLALYMALYVGAFAAGARIILLAMPGTAALWLLPALWVGLDWLRGWLFSGFPWMDPGYALAGQPELIQAADLFGHHGLTYLLVLVNTLPVLLANAGRDGGDRRLALAGPVALVLILAAAYSVMRWQLVEERMGKAERMTIGVVQGNISQDQKWSPDNQERTVATYIDQTASLFAGGDGDSRPVLVVWPETALPFYPSNSMFVEDLQQLNTRFDMALLTGAPWFEVVDAGRKDFDFFNSALLIAPTGQFLDRYSKSHLVPFGEYVPLKPLFPFLAPLVEAVGDFSPGAIEKPMVWRQARIGVLICFESIFPDIATQWVEKGANVLVNLTNDAWYGKSSAPYHSLAMTIMRSVETRRSTVRAANTGISGIIDPLGRVVLRSGLFEPWAAAGDVALLEGQTPWVKGGRFFAPLCGLVAALAVAIPAFRRRRCQIE
jgi:apolipoprotein N-acyltransferase